MLLKWRNSREVLDKRLHNLWACVLCSQEVKMPNQASSGVYMCTSPHSQWWVRGNFILHPCRVGPLTGWQLNLSDGLDSLRLVHHKWDDDLGTRQEDHTSSRLGDFLCLVRAAEQICHREIRDWFEGHQISCREIFGVHQGLRWFSHWQVPWVVQNFQKISIPLKRHLGKSDQVTKRKEQLG